jgi:hypothetical protein
MFDNEVSHGYQLDVFICLAAEHAVLGLTTTTGITQHLSLAYVG